MAKEEYKLMTAKELAEKLLALPEEEQNHPVMVSYYDDSESSVPVMEAVDDLMFCQSGFPYSKPHIMLLLAWVPPE